MTDKKDKPNSPGIIGGLHLQNIEAPVYGALLLTGGHWRCNKKPM